LLSLTRDGGKATFDLKINRYKPNFGIVNIPDVASKEFSKFKRTLSNVIVNGTAYGADKSVFLIAWTIILALDGLVSRREMIRFSTRDELKAPSGCLKVQNTLSSLISLLLVDSLIDLTS